MKSVFSNVLSPISYWDGLGSGTLCCSAGTSTKNLESPGATDTEKLFNRLKITACTHSWLHYEQWDTKRPKTQLPLLSKSRELFLIPAQNTLEGADNASYSSCLTSGPAHILLPHLRDHSSPSPRSGSGQGYLLLFFTPLCSNMSPSLVWIFHWASYQFLLIKESKNAGSLTLASGNHWSTFGHYSNFCLFLEFYINGKKTFFILIGFFHSA